MIWVSGIRLSAELDHVGYFVPTSRQTYPKFTANGPTLQQKFQSPSRVVVAGFEKKQNNNFFLKKNLQQLNLRFLKKTENCLTDIKKIVKNFINIHLR